MEVQNLLGSYPFLLGFQFCSYGFAHHLIFSLFFFFFFVALISIALPVMAILFALSEFDLPGVGLFDFFKQNLSFRLFFV